MLIFLAGNILSSEGYFSLSIKHLPPNLGCVVFFHISQTGKCENGACTVHLSLDVEIDDFAGAELHLLTDRTDGGKEYNGVDFDVLFISSCPSGPEVHCEAGSGKCVDGGCVCNDNIPCACPCDADGYVSYVVVFCVL